MMVIDNKYNIGDFIYLTTDKEQLKRLVVAVKVNCNGIIYEVQCGTVETSHFEIELSKEKDIIYTTERNNGHYENKSTIS